MSPTPPFLYFKCTKNNIMRRVVSAAKIHLPENTISSLWCVCQKKITLHGMLLCWTKSFAAHFEEEVFDLDFILAWS
jgi:hypothetical protein